jgi:hypothetical protein
MKVPLYATSTIFNRCPYWYRTFSGGGGVKGNNGGVVEDSDDQHQVNGDGGSGQHLASKY